MTARSLFVGKAVSGSAGAEIDRDEIKRAFIALADPDGYVELRAVPPGRSRVRPGSDLDGLADAAQELSSSRNVYLCLNPVSLTRDGAASDEHVTRRRWLFIDVDSVRPDAKNCCATAEEKEAARKVADGLAEHLLLAGWPEPVCVDSGNGWYLLFRIDMANDEESADLMRTFLHAIAEEFPGAKIDRAVHNASRLARLPGTWNRKGSDAADRPHRRARLVSVPDLLMVVTAEQIRAMIGPAKPRAAREVTHTNGTAKTPFTGRASDDEARAYANAGLRNECLNVVNAIPGDAGGHGRNNALNEAAFAMGQLVAADAISDNEVIDALIYAARQASLDEKEIMPTIQSGLRAGKKHPRVIPARTAPLNGFAHKSEQRREGGDSSGDHWKIILDDVVIAEGDPEDVLRGIEIANHESAVKVFEMRTLGSLLAKEFAPPVWIVPGLLSEGLNIIAGSPKVGKSMLSLNLALTVAGGGLAMGNIQVEQADVLYLSLEDKQRRVKQRALKMLAAMDPTKVDSIKKHLTIAVDWPKQDDGGLRLIEKWCRQVERPGLVIIDVWNRFAPEQKIGKSAYTQDAGDLNHLKKFAEGRNLAGVTIHHTRKPVANRDSQDFLTEVTGTMGLTGTADGVIVLARSRQESQARLSITGRDVCEQELVLEFDPNTLTWKSIGTAAQHLEGRVQKAIIAFLQLRGSVGATAPDIAEGIEEKPDSVRRALNRMLTDRIVTRRGNRWSFPFEEMALPVAASEVAFT